ncbi:hypothetical protein HDU77_010963 [Chytriomyces hyalinus]|nr:hypothetical protein HDU77_010963 [Chytriomyces hyalinus]
MRKETKECCALANELRATGIKTDLTAIVSELKASIFTAQVADRMPKETQVFCVLASDPYLRPFDVKIDSTTYVSTLKKTIFAKNMNRLAHVDACSLTLVKMFKANMSGLTKKEVWKSKEIQNKMAYNSKDLEAPEDGKDESSMFCSVPGAYMEKDGSFFKVMNSMQKACYYLDSTLDNLCHVLVLVPQENNLSQLQGSVGTPSPQVGPSCMKLESKAIAHVDQIKWKEEMPVANNLRNEKMADVVVQLQKVHRSKFARAVTGDGKAWEIPVADKVPGTGKSFFAVNYIKKSRESWDVTKRDSFQQTLCSCHTVRVKFSSEQLTESSFESVMLKYLKKSLKSMFVTPPPMLANDYKTVERFFKDLTEVAGPVFIVLEGIENGFKGDDIKTRDRFLLFCRNILGNWLELPKVFFVVLGHASIIKYIGWQPIHTPLRASGINFKRLYPCEVDSGKRGRSQL